MRVPSLSARRSAPLGAPRLTPVSVRTSRMSAAGRPTASPRAHPVSLSATGLSETTVACRSTTISAWGNCSNACWERVRSLAMSPQYRSRYAALQLLQARFERVRHRAQNPLIQSDVADGFSPETGFESIQTKPWVVRGGFFGNAPPVVGLASQGAEIQHRLPVQQIVR